MSATEFIPASAHFWQEIPPSGCEPGISIEPVWLNETSIKILGDEGDCSGILLTSEQLDALINALRAEQERIARDCRTMRETIAFGGKS